MRCVVCVTERDKVSEFMHVLITFLRNPKKLARKEVLHLSEDVAKFKLLEAKFLLCPSGRRIIAGSLTQSFILVTDGGGGTF